MSNSFGSVKDEGVMGVLRESLIESFLEPMLMPPYKAGTGIVTDSKGYQSGQCDIVIWDDSIFRPLYSARGAGIYLIESVVAVMEVKSTVRRDSVRQTIQRACDFKNMRIQRPQTKKHPNNSWDAEPGVLPLNILFGFRSDVIGSEEKRALEVVSEKGLTNLWDYLQLIVVPGKASWMFQEQEKGGNTQYPPDPYPYHEVLMPFAALLNSLKLVSDKRGKPNLGAHIVPYNPG
ncbi:MAG: hypothetical protein Q7T82_13575 [Armatimonadota bacterium]|nr:hypothetical protein [Armatimonadota bacterium]